MIAARAALIASPNFGFVVVNRSLVNQAKLSRQLVVNCTSALAGLAPKSTNAACTRITAPMTPPMRRTAPAATLKHRDRRGMIPRGRRRRERCLLPGVDVHQQGAV